jgi:phosphate/sulfate permease/DNA-directed RNA polymerase specialized sigma24 family protein
MTRYAIPVSTSQAVVGAIIGWSTFVGQATDYQVLSVIVSTWISGPILGLIFAVLLFIGLRKLLRRLKIHVIKLDAYIRISLIVVGAFGAYSLGANNIANVMGVFVNSAPDVLLDFGLFSLDGVQLLFLLGGLAIAAGIYTYSEKVMNTVGNGILSLNAEAAIVVVLSQALVLFIFSSSSLSALMVSIGLPAIPLVPVSSTQVVVGSVIGIGIVKGAREIKFRALGEIAIGWVVTPLAAGVLTYVALFFVQNVFNLKVTSLVPAANDAAESQINRSGVMDTALYINLVLPAVLVLAAIAIVILVFLIFRQQKLRLKAENELLQQQNNYYQAQKALSNMEVSAIQTENSVLNQKLENRRREYTNIALNITNQKEFLQMLSGIIDDIRNADEKEFIDKKLKELSTLLRQKMSFSDETEEFYSKIEKTDRDFRQKLASRFPDLTEQEKKLAILLRLNLSSKEISSLLGISSKSVEIARYRLRKRLNLKQGENLILFIQNL